MADDWARPPKTSLVLDERASPPEPGKRPASPRRRRFIGSMGLSTVWAVGAPGLVRAQSSRTEVLHMPAPLAGADAEAMPIHLHRPPGWTREAPLLVVLHGRQRNAAEYLQGWVDLADRAGMAVVVPEFSNRKFPGSSWYSHGHVVDRRGRLQPRERWALGLLDTVVDWVRERLGIEHARYALFGHSGGAQFVHRYLLLSGGNARAARARVVISANAGSYTMPEPASPFPWGLAGPGLTDAEMRAAYARPLVIMLGEADTDPKHPSLPMEPAARAQGPHRLARGQSFFRAAQAHAQALEAPFAWRLVLVAGVDHDGARMAPAALPLILSALA